MSITQQIIDVCYDISELLKPNGKDTGVFYSSVTKEFCIIKNGDIIKVQKRATQGLLIEAVKLNSFPPEDFAWALGILKNGGRVSREGWSGKCVYIEMQKPDEGSKMTLPYIYMVTALSDKVPWIASQTDILSNDWELVL